MTSVGQDLPEIVGRAWALLARAASGAQRLVAGPDGPLAVALVLALAAMLEAILYAEDVGTAMIANLLATLPIAFVRRSLPWAAGAIVLGVVIALSGDTPKLTVAAAVALAAVAYLLAARYERRWSALFALPFLVNAIAPFSESDGHASALLLLVIVVAAAGAGRRAPAASPGDRRARRGPARPGAAGRAGADRPRAARHRRPPRLDDRGPGRNRPTDHGGPARGGQEASRGDRAQRARLLTELRRLLGLLRDDGVVETERAPQPGLAELETLLGLAREAGSDVRLTMSGAAVPLPPGVDLTAYRIVQEALTNARRHAPGADVDVELRYTADVLHLEVRDHGAGRAAEADGHGIVGMRERAAMIGGTLEVGPEEGGGFAVRADLPIHEPVT